MQKKEKKLSNKHLKPANRMRMPVLSRKSTTTTAAKMKSVIHRMKLMSLKINQCEMKYSWISIFLYFPSSILCCVCVFSVLVCKV